MKIWIVIVFKSNDNCLRAHETDDTQINQTSIVDDNDWKNKYDEIQERLNILQNEYDSVIEENALLLARITELESLQV